MAVWAKLGLGRNKDEYLRIPKNLFFGKDEFRSSGVEVVAVAVSPDGKWVAAASRPQPTGLFAPAVQRPEVKVWRAVAGDEAWGLPSQASDLAISADGKLLAVATNESVEIRDLADGKRVAEFNKGHTAYFCCVAFAPDGQHLASGDMEGKVTVWDVKTGKEEFSLSTASMVCAAAFSGDGQQLAAGGIGRIDLWNLKALRRRTLPDRRG